MQMNLMNKSEQSNGILITEVLFLVYNQTLINLHCKLKDFRCITIENIVTKSRQFVKAKHNKQGIGYVFG